MRTELNTIAAVARHRRQRLAGATALALAALGWASFAAPLPRLTYNPSDSVAVGWYLVDRFEYPSHRMPSTLPVDSIVLVRLPASAAALAGHRGYLPTRIPLLKRVAAVWPQHVCIARKAVRIDGALVATTLDVDRAGRPLHAWRQCRPLKPGELFLMSDTNPASFDSRYFGPVDVTQVIGVAHPLWLK